MKKAFFLFLISVFSLNPGIQSFGQKNAPSETTNSDLFSLNQRILKRSLKYNDLQSATQALLTLLEIDPSRDGIKDTLCLIYFKRNASEQTVRVGNEILSSSPSKNNIREVVASAQKNLGNLKDALLHYETLLKETSNPTFQFEVAKLQYSLKRLVECSTSLKQLIGHPNSSTQMTSVNLGNNQIQKVPLGAASYNLLGIILVENNEIENAKKAFQAALELSPDFIVPANNLKSIQKN